MLALTIRQPWASLVAEGFKPVENRKWATRYRGELAIHAGKACTKEEHEGAVDFLVANGLPGIIMPRDRTIRSAILAVVQLVDCVEEHPSGYFTGPYGHVYAKVQRLAVPVPCSGAQGFWKLPPDVERKVREQL
jgi:hypothetical protein